jgi:hypothetical protein
MHTEAININNDQITTTVSIINWICTPSGLKYVLYFVSTPSSLDSNLNIKTTELQSSYIYKTHSLYSLIARHIKKKIEHNLSQFTFRDEDTRLYHDQRHHN